MITGNVKDQRPKSNIGFKKNFHNRKFTKRRADVIMEELKDLIGDLKFGSEYLFYVGKFTEDEKRKFNETIHYINDDDTEEEVTNKLNKKVWVMSRVLYDIDGNQVLHTEEDLNEMESIVSAYKSFETNPEGNPSERKCKFSVYGKVFFPLNFSKLGIIKESSRGEDKYPYGAIFFSDLNNKHEMIKGKIACVPDAAETFKKENNEFFDPLMDGENEFEVSGLIKTTGRLSIFYVDSEELSSVSDDSPEVLFPNVKTIEVLVSTIRNKSDTAKNGFIDKIIVSRVDKNEKLVENVEDYILSNVFAKNETQTNNEIVLYVAQDYIWAIGKDYRNYDISEEGFKDRRKDLNLSEVQIHIGEEYRKSPKKKPYNKPSNEL